MSNIEWTKSAVIQSNEFHVTPSELPIVYLKKGANVFFPLSTSIKKQGGHEGVVDSYAYSSSIEGVLTLQFNSISGTNLIGLTEDITNKTNWNEHDYIIHCSGDKVNIFEKKNGKNHIFESQSGILNPDTSLAITYNGANISYFINNENVRSVSRTSNKPLYAVFLLKDSNSVISKLHFAVMSSITQQVSGAIIKTKIVKNSKL